MLILGNYDIFHCFEFPYALILTLMKTVNISIPVLSWLLAGDPSVRWQVQRDLAGEPEQVWENERRQIARSGWGRRLLDEQAPDGSWGGGMYRPKWISTHYTLMTLRRLGLPPDNLPARKACRLLLDRGFFRDGGINFFASRDHSETCVTGMVLSLLAYFEFDDDRLHIIAGHLLGQQMGDGGWNCQSYEGDTHSSFHTTISVLEGLCEYEKRFPERAGPIRAAQARGREFLLFHRLFRSHRTGAVVDARMTRLSFPPRWRYDILRALDHFREAGAPCDERCGDAIALLRKKEKEGRWPLQEKHSGRTYFDMEKPGAPSRMNTLRVLRVLKWWEGGMMND